MFKKHVLKKISTLKVESFKEEILKKIDTYLNMEETQVKTKKNELNIKWRNHQIKVLIKNHEVLYEIQIDNKTTKAKYVEHKKGIFIKINEELKEIYDLNDNFCNNLKSKEIFKVYNKDGIENFRRETTKLDNYYENKKTGEITLCEPNIMENYTESCYKWRKDENYILERKIKKYIYPDGTKAFIDLKNSDCFYLRYGTIDKSIKEIPNYGEYYGIDSSIFFKYFQNKTTIEDVISNYNSKKYRRINTQYF